MYPAICLTNGRGDCLTRTLDSAREHLRGLTEIAVLNDCPDPEYAAWLDANAADPLRDISVVHLPPPHGYWRAMRAVWDLACTAGGPVFFLEDDFVIQAEVNVADLAAVLDAHSHLVQIALLRQPWFANERAHGGLIEALEAQGQVFTERSDGTHHWVEHHAVFTGNPSLIPARTFARDWPTGAWSESRFARDLFANPNARGAYWGRRTDPPRVEHIGTERVGTGY